MARETKTIQAMVGLYCRGHQHVPKGLCPDCTDLLAYALLRLEKCRYGDEKPACAKCPTHCYRADMRARVREVMRYAGPRMLWKHPILAVLHLRDGRRNKPVS